MSINTAIDAEVAYRHERIAQYFHPRRRVGSERVTARRAANDRGGAGQHASATGPSHGTTESAYGAPHHP